MDRGEESEQALVDRLRRGDRSAFEALARRFYRAAFAVALAVLGNRMDAEDACQDGFLRALGAIDQCRDGTKFRGWLLQIVRNGARNARDARRVRRAAPIDEPGALAVAAPNPDPAARADLADRLERALGGLTERQREIVLLHDLDGWKHKAIAEELGISEVACRQQLFVARGRLREMLGTDSVEEHING